MVAGFRPNVYLLKRVNASVQLLRQVVPSVVHLRATIPEDHPSAAILGTERMGTGTVVDRQGLLLTVNYVVLGARELQVTTIDGSSFVAALVAQDFATGLAVLKIPGLHVPARVRSSEHLQTGEEIFLLGSVGDGGHRVGAGAVSGLGSFEAYWEYALDRSIIATVANPGLGGGPVFDRCGRMVGVVSLNLNEIGKLSLSIPVENFLQHRDELLHHGRRVNRPTRAWVGVYCYTLHDHVVIAGLMPGSPAERAGLKAGDVVMAVDGAAISSRGELYRRLWTHRPGERVTFRVFRNPEPCTVEIPTVNVEDVFA